MKNADTLSLEPFVDEVAAGAADLARITAVEIACDECPDGLLVEREDGLGYRCSSCGYDDTLCDQCKQPMTFDATLRGMTCGGIELVGWMTCTCGAPSLLCPKSKPADAVDWRLAKSGASIHAGRYKIRAENAPGVQELMARIVRLPELEAEVERLRALLARRGGGK